MESFTAQLRRCRDHCDRRPFLVHRKAGEHRRTDRCRQHACRPLAPGTIRHIHTLIRASYTSAIRWAWISHNPMDRVTSPTPPRQRPNPPTPDQAALLVNESWRRGFGPLVWVAMTTGIRRGELAALQWSNLLVDHVLRGEHHCLDAGCHWTLAVSQAVVQDLDNSLRVKPTKTHQHRHIALDRETADVLLDLKAARARVARQIGVELSGECYIFGADPDGHEPSRPATLSQLAVTGSFGPTVTV